jgi:hypothetical protein
MEVRVPTITCLLTCERCFLVDAEVAVEARPESMDVKDWFDNVLNPAVGKFHMRHSPHCTATKLTHLKIPMDQSDGAWIGKHTDVKPPLGDPKKHKKL